MSTRWSGIFPTGPGSLPILRIVRPCHILRGKVAPVTQISLAHRLLTMTRTKAVATMRTGPRSSPSGAHRGARRVPPLQAFSRTEKIIAFCRVLLAVATWAVVVVDPKQPSVHPELGYLVLTAYVLYSAVLFLLVRGEHLRQEH